MEVRIELLADHPDLVDMVIGWHWREWSHGEANASIEDWRAKLVERSNRDRVPFALIAFADTEPVGCVSVCHDDIDARFADRGPWISGMLVVGVARNLGVGRALLTKAEEFSRQLGASELWLWTTEASAFYERCGWNILARKERLADATVMRRDLAR